MLGDYWLMNELAKERQTNIQAAVQNSASGSPADTFGKVAGVAIGLFMIITVIF
jgi:hypothetical protein